MRSADPSQPSSDFPMPTGTSGLVASRLCHDLINPLGAVQNGLELLELSQSVGGAEFALISESLATALARINLFRIAFGHIGKSQAPVSGQQVQGVLQGLQADLRFRLDWEVEAELPRSEAKLGFLLLMVLETALPFGGDASVRYREGRWQVLASAQRMREDEVFWRGLQSPQAAQGEEIKPAQVHVPLLHESAHALGRVVGCRRGDGTLELLV